MATSRRVKHIEAPLGLGRDKAEWFSARCKIGPNKDATYILHRWGLLRPGAIMGASARVNGPSGSLGRYRYTTKLPAAKGEDGHEKAVPLLPAGFLSGEPGEQRPGSYHQLAIICFGYFELEN